MKGYHHYEGWPAAGDVSGRLTAVRALPYTSGRRRWLWRCECGKPKEAYVSHVRNGRTQSCGCLYATHGEMTGGVKSPEYTAWQAMISRCENEKTPGFHRYGGRGISVCAKWRSDFAAFLADTGRKPSPTHSVERINGDGNYESENCKWATPDEQNRNTSRNIFVTLDGERLCLKDAAAKVGVPYGAALGRARKGERGEGLLRPSSRRRPIVWRGQELKLTAAIRLAGLSKSTVISRLSRGWSIEDALNTPRGAYASGQDWHNAH